MQVHIRHSTTKPLVARPSLPIPTLNPPSDRPFFPIPDQPASAIDLAGPTHNIRNLLRAPSK
jgi:hypothetical protein